MFLNSAVTARTVVSGSHIFHHLIVSVAQKNRWSLNERDKVPYALQWTARERYVADTKGGTGSPSGAPSSQKQKHVSGDGWRSVNMADMRSGDLFLTSFSNEYLCPPKIRLSQRYNQFPLQSVSWKVIVRVKLTERKADQ